MKKIITLIAITLITFSAFAQKYYQVENDSIVKIGLPLSHTSTDGKYWHKNYKQAPESVHYADGFRRDTVPVINVLHQTLGTPYYSPSLDLVTYGVDTIVYNIDSLRIVKKQQFSVVLNDFATLVTRCRLLHGDNNEALNTAIDSTRLMQQQTIYLINTINNLDSLLNFRIRKEDVGHYKSLFKPFEF